FSSSHPHPTVFSPLSLHDALPILGRIGPDRKQVDAVALAVQLRQRAPICGQAAPQLVDIAVEAGKVEPRHLGILSGDLRQRDIRSEEHTSELQSLTNLVCRLLLET